MKPVIVVTGSLNMDFVVAADQLPAPGQTVLGRDFRMLPGGKGANQACAAGRLADSAVVRMVGRVGYDVFADQLRANLAAANVDVTGVTGVRSQPTGVALIEVDSRGQNSIVVASGANFAFSPADVESAANSYRNARCALFQLETPPDTVLAAMRLARAEGATTILDPAPARTLDPEFFTLADILTPNETEACVLLGRDPAPITSSEAPEVAAALHAHGANRVLLKLGSQGCYYADGKLERFSPGFRVHAVDTTAAGDTFNGALAVALAEDQVLESALRFANAAAALSVTRPGAQASIPSLTEVRAFLLHAEHNPAAV